MHLTLSSFSSIALLALAGTSPAILSSDLETAAPLSTALDSVSERNISADIHFIASDELQGRDTPSRGLKIAARFIRSRLIALGLEPGAADGYFYEYPLDFSRIDGEKSMALLGGEELVEGKDYFTWFRAGEHLDVESTMVWVGEETTEAFEAAAPEGKWAITVAEDARQSRSARRKAQKAGAIGVLRLLPEESSSYRWLETSVARSIEGTVGYPRETRPKDGADEAPRKAKKPRDATFPFLFMRRADFEKRLGKSLDEMAAGTPVDMSLRDVRVPDEDTTQVLLENVCGFWPGTDAELSKEVVIISAHYDHVGTRDGDVYNGADDNGSGTTGLLALAEALTHYGHLRRSVMVMWVSGEEKGLYGSQAWTENPWLPEGHRAVANINIDMIGRNEPDSLLVTPTSEHEEYNGLTRLAERLAPLEGFPELGDADAYYERSDHYNFRKNLEIPVAFLFSDVHEDYHKATDTPDKIDCDKIRRVARLVMRMLDGMQDDVLEF